ncbi:MAG: bifunctional diguanylate cyclase/phosphodiesterase, partial [Actinoplanes sp.]
VCLVMMLVGDTAYAFIGTSGHTYTSPLLDAPYLVSYTMLGVTTLHPSVVELGRASRPPPPAWSALRMALLAPALATPFLLLALLDHPGRAERALIAVCGTVSVVLLLVRAVAAVHAQTAAQRRAEHHARHDPLTGLPNRRRFAEEVERLAAGADPVWVLLLDLDGFKFINESWGHDTGDLVVIEVGARLREAAPPQVPVAALGGDEFGLAYVGDQAGAERLVAEVHGVFARPFPVRGTDLTLTASLGMATASGDGFGARTAEALLRDADTAMYRAKDDGPGSWTLFDAGMHQRVRERIEMEMELRRALAAEQLTVSYQPIVGMTDGVPVGAEALVRWSHPELGPISPAVFIPIAEDAGLIGELGTWVRREALRQLGVWRVDGTVSDDFYLSINVSARQLTDPQLPLVVSAELVETGVPSRCVALEMTETVMVDGSTVTGRVLFELRELGFQLLIDDFGTGFSALGYLRRFPVTGVKIDRSFVTGLGVGSGDDEIVRAVAAMSDALGLKVIAEGVETRVQRDALAAVGVALGQGWLWGPAVPPAEFATHWHVREPSPDAARTRPVTR